MMADAVTFRAALTRIGFNQNTQDALNANGFNTISDLMETPTGDLKHLPKHLHEWRLPNVADADQVKIPFVSLRHLKAM
jgi:hypothetical protein